MKYEIATKRLRALLGLVALIVAAPGVVHAQRGGPALPVGSARDAAVIDLTGYWVSAVTEDWKFRMVTPNPGEYGGIPLSAEGRRVANTWDPAADEARGEACKSYAAPAIMRVPGRLHVTWQDGDTLSIETDAGTQTRLFRFGAQPSPTGAPTWQGHSVAEWQRSAAGGGTMRVVTTGLRAGYVRKNGVPYSENAVLTEYYDLHGAPNGDSWLVITTIVEDSMFNGPFVTSTNFKKLPDDMGWNPTQCSAS
jgi:hypothetical protein